ncbi:Wzz/FepE/Etk N-terminal domain-containing protein [Paraburkholderia sp. DD10]|uniref:Wzz/FepE/Etk N-terminal domain-containing protein n=1 Tax=Paraburkholderia TaxID=1822464 RepID=UPI003BA3070D
MKSLQSPENEALKNDDELDLIGVLDVLVEYRSAILKICLTCAALATAFAFLFPPRYQADISVQVEDGRDKVKSGVWAVNGRRRQAASFC